MPAPLDYLEELEGLDEGTIRRVVLDNARELNALAGQAPSTG
jgi:hypothetical protein